MDRTAKQRLEAALREGHVVQLHAQGAYQTLRRVRVDDTCLVVDMTPTGHVKWALRKLHEVAFDATFEFGTLEVERALGNAP